jgi:hypothetical protein
MLGVSIPLKGVSIIITAAGIAAFVTRSVIDTTY